MRPAGLIIFAWVGFTLTCGLSSCFTQVASETVDAVTCAIDSIADSPIFAWVRVADLLGCFAKLACETVNAVACSRISSADPSIFARVGFARIGWFFDL